MTTPHLTNDSTFKLVDPMNIDHVKTILAWAEKDQRANPPCFTRAVNRDVWALRALLAAMQREQERQWQPIETAPKDGTVVLFYGNDGVGSIIQAQWQVQEAGYVTGFYDANGFRGLVSGTHWMHLPHPPTTRSSVRSSGGEDADVP